MSEENVEIVRRSVNEWNAFMRGELSSEALAELRYPVRLMAWSANVPRYPTASSGCRRAPGVH